jgi:hypothetical protein
VSTAKKKAENEVVEVATKYDQTPSRTERRLTAKQFDVLKPRLGNVSESRVIAARRVLVDGIGVTEAGAEVGLPKQRVNDIVDRVLRVKNDISADWVRVNVWLPPAEAEKARQLYEKCKTAAAASAPQKKTKAK